MEQQHQGQPSYSVDDEIDLFELAETVWKGKWIIVAAVCLSLVVAGAAVWRIEPVYKSSVTFLPPAEVDLQEMNKLHQVDARTQKFDSGDVFQLFLENLTSSDLQMKIFHQFQLNEIFMSSSQDLNEEQQSLAVQQAIARFGNNLSLNMPSRNATANEHSLSLSLPVQPKQTATILNEMYLLANEATIADINTAITTERSSRIQQNLERIAALRSISEDRRLDRIAELDESISIARSLNIAEPREVGPDINLQGVSNQGLPMMYLGYRYLEAERSILLARKSDDPFIPGLREIQELVSTLERVSIDPKKFTVVRLRQSALPTNTPEKPKPMLMFSLASVAGLILGVMIVLIRQAIINRQTKVQ